MKKRIPFLLLSLFALVAMSFFSKGESNEDLMKRNKVKRQSQFRFVYSMDGKPDSVGTKVSETEFDQQGRPVVSRQFDSRGLIAWTDSNSYIASGFLITVWHRNPQDSSRNYRQDFELRPDGKPVSYETKNLYSGLLQASGMMEYDSAGNQILLKEKNEIQMISWKMISEYDKNGNLVLASSYNSIYGWEKAWRMKGFEYDANGRLVRINSYKDSKIALVSYFMKEYDAKGLISKSVAHDNTKVAYEEIRFVYEYYP